ncbi:MAG: hypothetical protein E7580_02595 [Ruminococcaceae bacterium]|nr:hypothetical protein [Oscillospiraceae bacterium]
MTTEEKELLRRAEELASRAAARGIYTRSAFLTEGEAALLGEAPLPLKPRFFGGFEEAERSVAVFGSPEEWGYEWESDLVLLKIEPQMQKFADALTHRDFLGAILNLGIKRDLLGDLLIHENVGYQFVLEQMADYLTENLIRVRHTSVRVTRCEVLPEGAGVTLEERFVVAASPRVDAVIGAVWNLSRSEAKKMVEEERVTLRGKRITDPSKELSEGDRISVRGYGRFYFDGEEKKTRSGRGRMKVRVFI